jgi:hypothetical protein
MTVEAPPPLVRSSSAGHYEVLVANQPAGQMCTVMNGAGKVAGKNVENVFVMCQ